MTNFNERTNTLLYKNIISQTLFLKGWCWLCVRDELETGTDCYIDPNFFYNHSSTSFSSWLGCSTVGHWGPKPPTQIFLSLSRHSSLLFIASGRADLVGQTRFFIPKTQKLVFDVTLLNTQHYNVMIKGKVKQPRERSSAIPYTLV